MDYNTSRKQMRLREYGRNFQEMVAHLKTIDDKEKWSKLAAGIVNLMGQMNPMIGGSNVEEYQQALWDSLYIMAGYELDIDSEYPMPDRELIGKHPEHPGYPKGRIRFKHYGKNVQAMAKKASEMEDEEQKNAFAAIIGNYMKLVYRNWNGENINDQIVIEDLSNIS